MKKMMVAIACMLIAFAGIAQKKQAAGLSNASAKVVDAASVPEAVKNAQETYFPGMPVTQWEFHEATSKKNNTYSKYVAVFKQHELVTRARYKTDGSSISSSNYFGPKKAPQVVLDAQSRYSGYKLAGGAQIRVSKSGKTFYKIKFVKGATKMFVYLDESGNEVTKDKAPEEVVEVEGVEGE